MKISKYIDIKQYNTGIAIIATPIIVTSVPIIVASVWSFIPQMAITTLIITAITTLIIMTTITLTIVRYFISQKINKIAPENEMKLLKMVEAEIIKRFPSEEIEDAMKAYRIPEPESIHDIPVDALPDVRLGHRIRLVDSNEHARIAGELGLNIDHLL